MGVKMADTVGDLIDKLIITSCLLAIALIFRLQKRIGKVREYYRHNKKYR